MGDKRIAPRIFGVVALLALLLSTGVPGAIGHDGHEVETVPYDLATPGPLAQASVDNPTPLNHWRDFQFGGNTLALDQGHTHVEIHLMDTTWLDVPGRVALYDEDGGLLVAQDFCSETELQIPAEAAELTVMASPLIDPCPVDGLNNGPATQGEILLVFH